MSQLPRNYREQILRDKLGLNKPEAGLLDVSQVSAMNKAIREKLDEQDREYAQQQESLKERYKSRL